MKNEKLYTWILFISSFLLSIVIYPSTKSIGGDWPGLLGPGRNGIASEDEKVSSNLDPAPIVAWELPAGDGYAGAAITDGYACLYDRDGDQDRIRMVSLADAKPVWEQRLPATYQGGIDSDRGPRCVPTITDQSVIVYSSSGDLTCIARKDGMVQWTRTLREELQAEDGYFGAGSTPLVFNDRIVVNVGGKKGGIVAVSIRNGKTIWKTGTYDASYASPVLVSRDSAVPLVLVPTRLKTVLLNSEDGAVVGEVPFGSRGPTVNAATPIAISPTKYLLTASYGIGTLVASVSKDSLTVVEQNDLLSSQYATPVFSNGLIYGSDGREDGSSNSYVCIDTITSKLVWSRPDMPICHSVLVDKKIVVFGIDGHVWALLENAKQWDPIWTIQLPDSTYRPLPAISNGLLITRSIGNDAKWMAVRINGS